MLTIELDRLALKPGAKVLDVGCGDDDASILHTFPNGAHALFELR